MPVESSDSDRNPGARRAYRILGILHAVPFGIGIAWRGFQEGQPFIGVAMGFFIGFAFLYVFWWMADEHYYGRVPGGGGLIKRE